MQSHHARLIAGTALLLLSTSPLAAQRTFVASYGSDADPCSLVEPCRSFTPALAQTNAGGEIVVLDSAGYGTVTIAKSVSIIAPAGVLAGITVSAGDGVIVNAAGIDVVLRGLAITGQGGSFGINFLDGASLRIEGCSVSGMSSAGIRTVASGVLSVKDTVSSDNGQGVRLDAGHATLERVVAERNNSRGVDIGNSSTAIHGGIFSHNGFEGISIHNVPTETLYVSVDGATVTNNEDGIGIFSADANGLVSVAVANSTVSANGGYGVTVVGTVNGGPARLYIANSTISNNDRDGISAGTNVGSTVYMTAVRNMVADNRTGGIRVTNSGTTAVADGNTVVRNQGHGLSQGGSTFYTRGNNTANGNTSGNTFGTLTLFGGV